MPAPSVMLRWASSVVAGYPGRTEPNSGQKTSGFDDNEAPPAAIHNWLFGLAGDWIAWLNAQSLRSVFADVSNTFTAAPQIIDVSDASLPLIKTTKSAAHDAHAGNNWKHIGQFAIKGLGAEVHVYTGVEAAASDLGALGSLLFAVNAAWNPTTSKWSVISGNSEAMALIVSARGIKLSQQSIGHAAWSTWPDGTRIDGAASGAGAAIACAGEYTYLTLPTRHKTLSIHQFTQAVGTWSINLSGALAAAAASNEALLGLNLPHGAQVKFYVLHTQTAASAPDTITVYRRRKTDWPADTLPLQSIPNGTDGQPMTFSGTSAAETKVFVTNSLLVDNANDSYDLSFVAGHAGNSVDMVWLEIIDPGPRNF